MITKILTILLLCTLPEVGFTKCEGAGTSFYFGNGMFNSRADALKSLRALKTEVIGNIPVDEGKDREFKLAYKESEPFLTQLFNVFLQKRSENYESFWLEVGNVAPAPQWLKDAAVSFAVNSFADTENFAELEDHIRAYTEDLHRGYQVILVSHSQGNLYANRAAEALSRWKAEANEAHAWNFEKNDGSPLPNIEDVFSVIQVATPASRTVMDAPWTTYEGDIVMDFVRKTASALPANIPLDRQGLIKDFTGHSFTETYLKLPEAKAKIISDIKNAYDRMKYPLADEQTAFELRGEDDLFGFGSTVKGSIQCEELASHHALNVTAHAKFGTNTNWNDTRWEAYDREWEEGLEPISRPSIHPSNEDRPQFWRLGEVSAEKASNKEPMEVTINVPDEPTEITEEEWIRTKGRRSR